MHPAVEIAEELAALTLDEGAQSKGEVEEAIRDLMARRQKLVDRLGEAVLSPMSDAERAKVKALLESRLARDAHDRENARRAMTQIDRDRDALRDGRKAVIGYRAAARHGVGAILKTA